MCFKAIRENKILAKIPEFTVFYAKIGADCHEMPHSVPFQKHPLKSIGFDCLFGLTLFIPVN